MPDAPHHHDPHAPDSVPTATPRSDRRVEDASEQSFPASDPPTFTPTRSGRAERHASSGLADAATPEADATSRTRQWAESLVDALDAEELEAVGRFLTDDAVVRWGEGPLLVGRAAALKRLAEWFRASGPLERHVIDARGDDDAVFIELDVRGLRGGQRTTWPEAISARLRQGAASRLTVYGVVPGEAIPEDPAAPS